LTRISTIQNYYSILGRTFEVGLSEMCLRENIGLLPFSVLNRGVISGKYLGGARPPGARFTLWERDIDRYNPSRVEPAVKAYMALAKKIGIEPAQLAIAFASSRAFTTSVIIAATSLKQL